MFKKKRELSRDMKKKKHKTWTRESSFNRHCEYEAQMKLIKFQQIFNDAFYVSDTGFKEGNRLELAMGIH